MKKTERSSVQQVVVASKPIKRYPFPFLLTAVILIIVILVTFVGQRNDGTSEAKIITVSTLKNIVNVNELSTFTAVYNGVAKVYDEEDPQEITYYVSYDAKVYAGIDVKKIDVSIDQEKKLITIRLPDVFITDINVQASTLDFIFVDEDANTGTVVAHAYQLCEEDALSETQKNVEIKDLAKQNAINTVTALTKPFVEQLDTEYTLVIQ